MPIKIPSQALIARMPWRRVAGGCAVASALCLAGSLILVWLPLPESLHSGGAWQSGLLTLPQLILALAACLGMLAGVLSLVAPAAASTPAPEMHLAGMPPDEPSSELLAVVQELRVVLADERSRFTAFQEACSDHTREARIVNARLGEAAMDAETRLAAGVAQADEALRQSAAGGALAAETAQRAERLLPEIADLIRRGIAEQSHSIATTLNGAVARLAAEADGLVQSFRAAAADAGDQMTALGQTAVALRRDVIALDTAGREIATASATVVSRVGGAVGHVDTALAHLPVATAAVTAAAEQASQTMAEAAAGRYADGVAQDVFINEIRQAAEALHREAAALGAAKQELEDTGHRAIAAVAQTAETAASQLVGRIADAGHTGQDAAGLAELTITLEKAAATIVDGASSLDAAGQRVAAAGECVAARLAADTARSDAALGALPDATAELTAVAADLRLETFVLTAAAQQMSAMCAAATAGGTEVAVRAEISAESLNAAGQIMSAASVELTSQMDRLAGATRDAETQTSMLPDLATQIATAAARMHAVTEAWPPEVMLTILPMAAARLEAASPALDRLDALSWRLENAMAAPPSDPALEAAVRRVEAALTDHEGVWATLAASIDQVQSAALAVAQAAGSSNSPHPASSPLDALAADSPPDAPAADSRPDALAADSRPDALAADSPPDMLAADSPPDMLAATLRRLNDVSCQTKMLLQQTEALAEAAINDHAPGLPLLLADRTPALLAGIEETTWRLRSVATALALVSDGVPKLERRLA